MIPSFAHSRNVVSAIKRTGLLKKLIKEFREIKSAKSVNKPQVRTPNTPPRKVHYPEKFWASVIVPKFQAITAKQTQNEAKFVSDNRYIPSDVALSPKANFEGFVLPP